MRANHRETSPSDSGARGDAPAPRSLAGSPGRYDRIQVVRFDWKVKAGIQPVVLVTRRRLD